MTEWQTTTPTSSVQKTAEKERRLAEEYTTGMSGLRLTTGKEKAAIGQMLRIV